MRHYQPRFATGKLNRFCYQKDDQADNIGRIYLGVPTTKTSVSSSDFQPVDETSPKLAGGFYYGASRNGMIYIPPRPLLNHGIHRCEQLFRLSCNEPQN